MKSEEVIARAYDAALAAKKNYEHMRNALVKVAKAEGAAICFDLTVKAKKERPDLFRELELAYRLGEKLKDEIQSGGRWPKGPAPARYSDVLRAVPPAQMSPELTLCLEHWEKFEAALNEIKRLYPPPQHFYWNGPNVVGPNLFQDFGISL